MGKGCGLFRMGGADTCKHIVLVGGGVFGAEFMVPPLISAAFGTEVKVPPSIGGAPIGRGCVADDDDDGGDDDDDGSGGSSDGYGDDDDGGGKCAGFLGHDAASAESSLMMQAP